MLCVWTAAESYGVQRVAPLSYHGTIRGHASLVSFPAECDSVVRMYRNLCACTCADERFGQFPFGSRISKAEMNIWV